MPKIYAVEQGNYSNYHIVGVYSSPENAKLVIDNINATNSYQPGILVEWELDKNIDLLKQGYKTYYIRMLKDGTVESLSQEYFCNETSIKVMHFGLSKSVEPIEHYLWCIIMAKSAEHAIKIANEHRLQLIAENKL